jgi:iron(III) transport system substrate-binding protein
MMVRACVMALGLTLAIGAGAARAAEVPAGYPADYGKTLAAAEKEGTLVIYANTEQFAVNPILEDFQAAYPKIKVDYLEVKAADLYSRVSSEVAAGALKADFVWSSAMDLQFQLADEGAAMAYASPEKKNVPGWSTWEDQLYGITFEPVVFVYNKKLIPEADVPHTRDALANLLTSKAQAYAGKAAAYDPERSGLGFFVMSHDAKINDDIWKVARGLGAAKGKTYTATGTMLEKVASGEHAIAYDVIGPYALLKADQDPNVGVVIPQDFTLILTRLAMIPKAAQHPNAAKVFLDYLLSKRGQTVIADKALLYSIRSDVEGRATAAGLTKEHGPILKPVSIRPELMDELDPAKRLPFFSKWTKAVSGR